MPTLLTDLNKTLLSKGTLLLRYPREGEPVQSFPNEIDIELGNEWEVQKIHQTEGYVEIIPIHLQALATNGILALEANPMAKKISEMINEEIWWILSND